MIARIWHGKTSKAKSEQYKTFLLDRAVPDYQSVSGLQGIQFLHRIENDEAHFTLITFWPSIDVIRKFAGEEYEKAKYYPEDNEFLLEFEENVVHHDVFYYGAH